MTADSARRWDDARRRRLIRALCRWFDANARSLPWRRRRHRTGYGALVAEAMLQQTQVSRVIERYGAFMRRFPAVRALAQADEQDVLAMWQGLGYYRRARSLQAAARMIVADFAGRVPADGAALRRLPGVGRYTAGAIASIIFNRPEPIVDGNVARVLARLHGGAGGAGDPDDDGETWTWDESQRLVKLASRPGAFNEALMELGAMVCTPRAPRCGSCPVASCCDAHRMKAADRIPPPKDAPARQVEHHHAALITRRRGDAVEVLLQQRDPRGLWANMWQPPTVESDAMMDAAAVRAAFSPLRRRMKLVHLTSFKRTLTHRTIVLHVFAGELKPDDASDPAPLIWRPIDALADLPISNAHRRVLGLLEVERLAK